MSLPKQESTRKTYSPVHLKNTYITLCLALSTLTACGDKQGSLFQLLPASETGITFENTLTETDDLNILDYLYFYNGGGVAVGDIDNDGLADIFFSGNQVKNKLYRNKGNLQFEDISKSAGIEGNSTWNTGSVMGDVNGDGLLDIYVCAVVGINGFNGHNELFLNNGDGTFTESAAKYGLDFDSYSSNAAFLDFDLDGDLDIYLLNHAVHTQESFGKADLRLKRNYQTGDKLLRNDGDKFVDVSESAGIYGGVNGYGLGLAISDFNQDGYPDIYVGNDFHEDDYYYLNNGDGTFTESSKQFFAHTSRFSMGNDVADINHDGWPDLISLDMLPQDEHTLKSSEGDDNVQTQKLRTERYGYGYQFTRNMLNINQQNSSFLETALMSGVAATDWSWSALFGDYDQDGEQDLFISNGIPKRPNDLDFINFVSSEQIRNKMNNTKLMDQQALDKMPAGKIHNYVFKGSDNLTFKDKSGQWISKDTLVSGATAMGDLDNDGDLDLITNNLNGTPALYINKTDQNANFLKISLKYGQHNPFGLGTKVFSYTQGQLQYKELYTVRGFQASSEPILHFGYGKTEKIDSLRIVWPDGSYQTLTDIATNQSLEIRPENTKKFNYSNLRPQQAPLFEKVENNLGIDFLHIEDNYTDFNRQKLIPYQISDRGPATAIGDLNGDGKKDIFFGGSKYIPSQVFVQNDTTFSPWHISTIANDSIKEDIAAVIGDFNSDGKNDLILGTGGGDFYNKMKPLLNSYYVQNDAGFNAANLPESFQNTSVLAPYDMDGDGDLDLFLGSQAISNDFGKVPESALLLNDNGSLIDQTPDDLKNIGMVTNAIWHDFDADGTKDLIVVGEWMSPTFFKNTKGQLTKIDMVQKNLNGLWQSIVPFDIDNDGDTDYLLGNWGSNTKFKASAEHPMKMYYGDFDKNRQTETITTIEKDGKYYPLEGLDGLSSQLVSLKKKFNTYKSFAGSPIESILDREALKNAKILEVHELRSGFLKNENGRFSFVPFPNELQVSPLMAMLRHDFDGDGKEEVLAAGNYFGVKPYHGRFDSFGGALIKGENNVILSARIGLDLSQKSVRHLNLLPINGENYLLITLNNSNAQIYRLKRK
ncbi:VCBS repeat-containing protein [Zobellia galactanivorans]|uniref:VCBS repeat-containing protein n=1 Tax=Zobellia galactanivorans (strain DSM 12802 / CCUG 47099 / CIP 106680 / NCIMB 13871 / Dsij) TaxID=63186 RepID=UPI0026E1900B|nr:VCBS repeat-containing protein [Zobellia galactanivorans]MDO6808485.1 VCBS repeat-containing protein [Zobellia galactanivorans]